MLGAIVMPEDPTGESRKPAEPSVSSIRLQLDRMLQSLTFANAPGLSRFLRHLVEQAIGGNTAPLKEYSVGVEVFERGESFDPRIDTIVRVQARKLRAKLGEYYSQAGQSDAVVIEVPKGQYVATFRHAADAVEKLPIPIRVPLPGGDECV